MTVDQGTANANCINQNGQNKYSLALKQSQMKIASYAYLFSLFLRTVIWQAVLWTNGTWTERKAGSERTPHLQRDHRDLALAVTARGLAVFTGLLHVVAQVFPQDFLFAVCTDTRELLKLAVILQMNLEGRQFVWSSSSADLQSEIPTLASVQSNPTQASPSAAPPAPLRGD